MKTKRTVNHDKWLRKHNVHPEQLTERKKSIGTDRVWHKEYAEMLREGRSTYKSSGMSGSKTFGMVRGIMANISKESPEVQREILTKAMRTAPAWNKGAYQYITDDADKTTLGRKQ